VRVHRTGGLDGFQVAVGQVDGDPPAADAMRQHVGIHVTGHALPHSVLSQHDLQRNLDAPDCLMFVRLPYKVRSHADSPQQGEATDVHFAQTLRKSGSAGSDSARQQLRSPPRSAVIRHDRHHRTQKPRTDHREVRPRARSIACLCGQHWSATHLVALVDRRLKSRQWRQRLQRVRQPAQPWHGLRQLVQAQHLPTTVNVFALAERPGPLSNSVEL